MSASIRKRDQLAVSSGSMSVSEYVQKHGRSPASHMREDKNAEKRNKNKESQYFAGPPTQKNKKK